MPEIKNGLESQQEQRERVYQAAHRLFSSSPAPDWVTFFRKILGLNGLIRRTYPAPKQLAEFEQSQTYTEILGMLTRLRERALAKEDPREPIRMITVRLPKSLHEALRAEAHDHHTSMNKLCISKLLQFIDNELIPRERWRSSTETGPDSETADLAMTGDLADLELSDFDEEVEEEEEEAGADL